MIISPLPSRNAPCPCGSGKRYKQCHGAAVDSPSTEATAVALEPSEVLQEGFAHLRAGRRAAALASAQRVLAVDPDHPDAWHLNGLIDLANGNAGSAITKFERAIASYPAHCGFHASRVRAELALGNSGAAQSHARDLTRRWPGDAAGWTLLGICLVDSSPEEAQAALNNAIRIEHSAEAVFELGRLLQNAGRHAQAVAVLAGGLARHPGDPQLLNSLALAQEALGNLDEAKAAWHKALAARPGFALARANLGRHLFAQGRYADALRMLEPPAAELAASLEYFLTLAFARQALGRFDDAAVAFKAALELSPDDPKLRFHLGAAYFEIPRIDEAVFHLSKIPLNAPEYEASQIMLLELARRRCDWAQYRVLIAHLPQWLAHAGDLMPPPHAMLSLPVSASELKRVALAYNKCFGPVAPPWSASVRRRSDSRLRLAYLSSAIREHPTSTLISEVLERHDRRKVEIFVYSCGRRDASPYRRRIELAAEHFFDFDLASDEEIITQIRTHDIDILIDLDGHTQHSRNRLLAKRPAPVQINFLGFPGTLGTAFHDYILTDRVVTPPDQQDNFTERFIYLPHCYLPSDTRRRPSGVLTRAQCELPEGRFVFCSFNNLYKLLPDTFDLWMDILHRSPGAVLWMLAHDTIARNNLRKEAAARGIDPGRLVFGGHAPLHHHLARYPLADLFLDNLPCNAHTTCNDALLMGLPVLSCAGQTFPGRVAASQLHAAGLPELAVANLSDYLELAVALTQDPKRLGAYRRRLVAADLSSPLFDMASYTRALEDRLLSIRV